MHTCASWIALYVIAAASLPAQAGTTTAPVTINGKSWRLAWAEEFNHTGRPNPRYWDYDRLPLWAMGEKYGWPRCGEIDIMEYNGERRYLNVEATGRRCATT